MISTNSLEFTNVRRINLIRRWVALHVSHEILIWLDEKTEKIVNGANEKIFFTTFSTVPRYTGKNDLNLVQEDLEISSKLRPGWFPNHWSVDQAARTLLLLSLPKSDSDKYLQTLERLFSTADVGELVVLYQALPLLSNPEELRLRAAEGVRSNMVAVFNAIALKNPYPAEYFDNLAWNQMILKALFVGSPLHSIQGLQKRANSELAKMLIDYARERQSAKRAVPPELWRLVEICKVSA